MVIQISDPFLRMVGSKMSSDFLEMETDYLISRYNFDSKGIFDVSLGFVYWIMY